MKKLILAALLIAILAPANQAATDVREYTADAIHVNDADGVVAATSFSYPTAPFSYSITARRTVVAWAAGITSLGPSIVGTDSYTVTLTIKEGATTRITCDIKFLRDNTLAGSIQYLDYSFCDGTALVGGTTYTYEFAVTMGTGMNRISAAVYSMHFIQTDSVTVPDPATTSELSTHDANNTNYHNHLNGHVHDFQSNFTAYLNHVNVHLHYIQTRLIAIDANVNFTRGEILDALDALNVTIVGNVTGNFTVDNATLANIYAILLDKFGPIGEPVDVNFEELTDWIPLLIAFAILALATMRAKPNYLAVIIAGAFFAYAAYACPFDGNGIRMMVALFGVYNVLIGALETRNSESNQAMEG